MLQGEGLDLLIIHFTGSIVEAVLDRVVDLAGEVDAGAVGEVTAIRQAHPQHSIAGGAQGLEHRRVGLGTGMGLHVGVGRPEQGLGALNRQGFSLVHIFAAAVVALAGVALGVLVGQHRALGLQHARTGVVLGGDQLDMLFLAALLLGDGGEYLVVEAFDAHVFVEHGVPLAGCRATAVTLVWKRRILPQRDGADKDKNLDKNPGPGWSLCTGIAPGKTLPPRQGDSRGRVLPLQPESARVTLRAAGDVGPTLA